MSDERVMRVLEAFERVGTRKAYTAAKRLASKLDSIGQYAIVDAAIAAVKRVRSNEAAQAVG